VAYFRYKVMEPTGKINSGIVKLPYEDIMSVTYHLERDDNSTIYVKKLGIVASLIFRLISSVISRRKVTRSFQAEFLSNISLMLRSGITLTTALEEAASGSDMPDFEGDIRDMITRIQGGATFSDAADKYRYIFHGTIIHLIRIGEETGNLDKMLLDASEHLKRIQTIVSDTKQALLYPSFVLIVMGAGLLFWFYYVVPKIVSLFKDMDVTLPTITVILLNISAFLQDYFVIIILGVVSIIIILTITYKGNRLARRTADALFLRLPVLGTIISASALAFITEYFSIMLRSGIDILQSIRILKESIKNEVYREKLDDVISGLTRGEGVSDSFRSAIIFPPFVIRMISVGELSGTLDQQLANIAENYRNKLSLLVATIGKMIEPIVLIIAGILFAIIIGGLFLPIYDLVSQVGGR